MESVRSALDRTALFSEADLLGKDTAIKLLNTSKNLIIISILNEMPYQFTASSSNQTLLIYNSPADRRRSTAQLLDDALPTRCDCV